MSTKSSSPSSLLSSHARQMRFNPTDSEAALWRALSGKRLGVQFRRQAPLLGRFIADFLAPEIRLIVEVDGGYHSRREAADGRREAKLQRAGYHVLRLPAELVTTQLSEAVTLVASAVAALRGGP